MARYSVSFFGLFLLASSSHAEPVLLTSFQQAGGFAGVSPNARVGFVLGLFSDDVDNSVLIGADTLGSPWPFVQPTRFWEQGERGILEFSAANEPKFAEFALLASDGVNDSFVTWEGWDPFAIGGHGGSESRLFGTSTDLVGYTLELIKIHVEDVHFIPGGMLGDEWQWEIRYEFFGSPAVPEPSSLALLSISGLLLWKRKNEKPSSSVE